MFVFLEVNGIILYFDITDDIFWEKDFSLAIDLGKNKLLQNAHENLRHEMTCHVKF